MYVLKDPLKVYKIGQKVRLKEQYKPLFSMGDKVGTVVKFDSGNVIYVLVDYDGIGGGSFPFVHHELCLIDSLSGIQYEFEFME